MNAEALPAILPSAGTRIGFGCVAIPGAMSRREALALLETALDRGITHFDTARMYGAGAAEGVLGQLAARRRAEMTIVSKAGIAVAPRFERAARRLLGPAAPKRLGQTRAGKFAPAELRASVDISLRELRTDYLDALLLHEVLPHHVTDELVRELEALSGAGKVRAYGIATSREATEAICAAYPRLCAIVQVPAAPPGAAPGPRFGDAFLIEHTVLRSQLDAAMARFARDAEAAQRLQREFGVAPGDRAGLGRLLLMRQISLNPGGITLFSSSSPERVSENASLRQARIDAEQMAAFDRLVAPSA